MCICYIWTTRSGGDQCFPSAAQQLYQNICCASPETPEMLAGPSLTPSIGSLAFPARFILVTSFVSLLVGWSLKPPHGISPAPELKVQPTKRATGKKWIWRLRPHDSFQDNLVHWFIDSSLPLQNQSAKCCSIFLGICVPSVLQTLLMFCLQFAQARRFTFRPMQLVQATEHLYSCLSFLVYIALSWSLQKTKGFNRHQHRICISPPKCLFPKPKS